MTTGTGVYIFYMLMTFQVSASPAVNYIGITENQQSKLKEKRIVRTTGNLMCV